MQGRESPNNNDAERGILCCILLNARDSYWTVEETGIHVNCFYKPDHQIIFDAMRNVYVETQDVEEISLAEYLDKRKLLDQVGGYAALNRLTNVAETTAHLKHWCDIVIDKFVRRQIISKSTIAIDSAYKSEEGFNEILRNAESAIFSINKALETNSAVPVCAGIEKLKERINEILARKLGHIDGIVTDLNELDEITCGFKTKQMIVIGANQKVGKTSFMTKCVQGCVAPKEFRIGKDGQPERNEALIFSLEMDVGELTQRLVSQVGQVNMLNLKKGNAEHARRFMDASQIVKKMPIHIHDQSDIDVFDLRSYARRFVAKHPNCKMICVDYVGLLKKTSDNQQLGDKITEASQQLKNMAKELDVVVIVLSQMNKDSRKGDRRPVPSDLNYGSQLESDCHKLILIDHCKNQPDCRMVYVPYQRDGQIGECKLKFLNWCQLFDNVAETPDQQKQVF